MSGTEYANLVQTESTLITPPGARWTLKPCSRSGGEFADGTVHVQDTDGVVSVDISDITADNIGTSGINVLSTVSQDFYDLVNDAVTGDRIIVALTQPGALNVSAEIGNLSTGNPSVSVSATPRSLEVSAEIGNLSTGSPTVTVEVTPVSPNLVPVSVDIGNISTGNPTVSVQASVRVILGIVSLGAA